MAWLSEGERRARIQDTTRDRTVLLNQMLLAGVTLVTTLTALALDQVQRPSSYVVGMAAVYIAAGAAVVVPWKRLPEWAAAIIPIVDIVAIAFLRESAPQGGVGLMWAFPAMWIASIFGVPGVIAATVGISALFVGLILLDPTQDFSTTTVLLPLTIAALATISALATRRAQAQRELLDKQARQLQRSVERARRQEDLVTEALDAVDFGVIRITPDGELVVTNEAHARLQGRADLGGSELLTFAGDGVTPLEPAQTPLARARRGETFENELVWYGSPGEGRRALTLTARRLTDIDGSAAGVIVVSRDVTTEEQALRAREDLIASVSHELRTPLTSILGFLELALDGQDVSPQTRQNLTVAERNAERLLELVTDILDFSTASRQGVELGLHREPVDLSAIVLAAAESLAPRAADRRIVLDVSDVRPAVADVDPHRIRQVIDNLLTNAVKYHHDGGVVRAALGDDGSQVWFTVSDDGPGISPAEQPMLFDRFFRSDAVRNSTTHGSGLGLAISRDIVRAHGGDIYVQSQIGVGTTFTVRLPMALEGEDA